jgi:hypothetical protein
MLNFSTHLYVYTYLVLSDYGLWGMKHPVSVNEQLLLLRVFRIVFVLWNSKKNTVLRHKYIAMFW